MSNRLRLAPLPIFAALSLTVATQGSGDSPLDEGRAKLEAGEPFAAAEIFEAVTREEPENAQAWYLLGHALHAGGEYEVASEVHRRAAEFPEVRAGASYNAACAFARLEDADAACEWLGRAVEAGFHDVGTMMTDPDLAGIRSDPRFSGLLPTGIPATFVEGFEVLYALDGEAQGDRYGWIGRNAGDVDGDGVADLLISAPFKDLGKNPGSGGEGRIYVHSGKSGELLFQCDGRPGYQLGIGIECAGDVNGDGSSDQLAGASGAKGTGAAFVYSGKDGALLLEVWGEAQGDQFGRKVAGAGDQDGDGVDDFVVGAMGHDAAGTDAGRAYLFSGADGSVIATLDGEEPGDNFGSCVDGYSDGETRLLIIGAQHAGPEDRGYVAVFRMEEGGPELAFRIESQPGDVNLGRMFVSAVGDVDGDGVVDVYGSDWESHANGMQASGRIYVHSGADGRRLHVLSGEAAGDGFGIGTAEAGDVDGDGCDDLLIGAWQNDAGAPGGGRCYLYSGKSGELLRTYTCSTYGDTFGFDTTGLGDVDGDGTPDFLITSADSLVQGPQSGRVFVVSGAPFH